MLQYKRAFEQLLPGMRKLPFKHEVNRDVTPREELKAVLIKEIDEEMTAAEFRANELGMKVLGLLPREINLKETMVKVYSEEIAAFYDTKTKTMHLIKEPEAKKNKAPSFLERLLGKTGGFDKDENKTVIAHELTHALADQNFDIDALQKAVKTNDDQSLALSALIEGEATLTMLGAGMADWNGSSDPRDARRTARQDLRPSDPADAAGRRRQPPRGAGDPVGVDDLPLPPRPRLLRASDQRRRLERARSCVQPAAPVDRADHPPREIPHPARPAHRHRPRQARPRLRLDRAGPERRG